MTPAAMIRADIFFIFCFSSCFCQNAARTARLRMPPVASGCPPPTPPLPTCLLNNPHRIRLQPGASALLSTPHRLGSALLEGIVRMSATRANGWLEVLISGSLSTTLLVAGVRRHQGPWLTILTTVLAGLLVFSFIEYVFHRWIFHGPDSLFRRGHDAHHRDPQGYDALPFFLPATLLLGLVAVFWWIMPASYAYLLGGAIGSGYVAYGLSHFAIHATRFRQPWLNRWAGQHHIHHYHADRNFGVTSPLWDCVLGTRYRRGQAGGTKGRAGP